MPKPSQPSSSSRTAPTKGKGSSSAKSDAPVSSRNAKSKERPASKAKQQKSGDSIGGGVIWLVIGTVLLGFGVVGFLVYQELLNGTKRELLQTAQAQAQPILKQFEQVQKNTENLASKLQAVQVTKPKSADPYRKAVIDQGSNVISPLLGIGMVSNPANQLFQGQGKGNAPAPYVMRKEGVTIPQSSQPQALPAPNDKLVALNRTDASKLPILTNSSQQPTWTNTYDSYGTKVIAFAVPLGSGKPAVAAAYGELHLGQLAQVVASSTLGKTNPETTVLLVAPDGMIWGNTSTEGGGQTGQSYQTIPSLSSAWATLQTQGAVQSEGKLWVNTPLGVSGWQVVAGTSEQKIWLRTLPIVGGAAAGTLALVGGGLFWFLGSLRRRFNDVDLTHHSTHHSDAHATDHTDHDESSSSPQSAITNDHDASNPSSSIAIGKDNSSVYADNTAGDLHSLNDSLNLDLDDSQLEYPEITTDLSGGVPADPVQHDAPSINPLLGAAAVGVAVAGVAGVMAQSNSSQENPPLQDPPASPSVVAGDGYVPTSQDHVDDYADLPLDDLDHDLDDVPAENLMADYADKYALPLNAMEPAAAVTDSLENVSLSDDSTSANSEYAYDQVLAEVSDVGTGLEYGLGEALPEGNSYTEFREGTADVFVSDPSHTDDYQGDESQSAPNITTGVITNDDVFSAPIENILEDGIENSISEEAMLAMELAEANLAMNSLAQEGLDDLAVQSEPEYGLSDHAFHFPDETILQNSASNNLADPLGMDYVPATTPDYTSAESDPFALDPFAAPVDTNSTIEVDPFGTMDLLGNVDRQAVEEESQLEAFDPLMETIGQNVNYAPTDEPFAPLPPLVPQLHESLDTIDSSEVISYELEEIGEPDWGQAKNEFAQPYADDAYNDAHYNDGDLNYAVAAGAELLEEQLLEEQLVDEEFSDQFSGSYSQPYDQYAQDDQVASSLGQGNMDYAPDDEPIVYDPAAYTEQNYSPDGLSLDYGATGYTQENYLGTEYAPGEYGSEYNTGEYGTDPYSSVYPANYAEGYVQGMETNPHPYDEHLDQFSYSPDQAIVPENAPELLDYQSSYEAYSPQPDANLDYSSESDDYGLGQQYGTEQYIGTEDQFNYDDVFGSSDLPPLEEASALPELELEPDGGNQESGQELGNALTASDTGIANGLDQATEDATTDQFSDQLISMGDETAFSFASLENSLMSSNTSLEQITSGNTISELPHLDDLVTSSLPDEINLDFLADSDAMPVTSEGIPESTTAPQMTYEINDLANLSETNLSEANFLDDDAFKVDDLDSVFGGSVALPSLTDLETPSQSLTEPSSAVSFLDVVAPMPDQEPSTLDILDAISEPTDPFTASAFTDNTFTANAFTDSTFSQFTGESSSVFTSDTLTNHEDLGLDPFAADSLVEPAIEQQPQTPANQSVENQGNELLIPTIPDLEMDLGVDLDADGFFDELSNDDISNSILELEKQSETKAVSAAFASIQEPQLDELDFGSLSLLDDVVDDLLLDDLDDSPIAPDLAPNLNAADDLAADDDFNFDDLMLEINKPLSGNPNLPQPSTPKPPDAPSPSANPDIPKKADF